MLALLHTSPVHVPVFDALRDEDHPGLTLRHLVHEDLLARAGEDGPEAVAPAVAAVLSGAVAQGATVVLCTCSTIGAVAEASAADLGVPVLRVDRPMAAAAAERRRIVVVAAVHSTLEPTAALIREEAVDRIVELRTLLVEGAWERFEAGDRDGYLDAVAAAVDEVREADVIVLAQASMADAAARTATAVPVLSSPRPGLRAAAAATASGS
ncbi:arylsulfatase [Streptomyces lunaelactis]|uniref:aspartate/glutamate racemase family protein n=2 Tax=Streptomyces lunaelactis TaxID=1535768 RepID=UPI0015848661|nr:aspartate/glutamate racemase family protein [Streptomyces lunaelactis]NUK39228.1 arylsulfatase [Streptomyces lunaelactis]NUK46356.1 arylsulfatase [Streptomyces lunaelactis]NUK55593.1 arylsulfatase [Streptomyces lunaelactis]NUK69277.1 arylsulfatase [Streptomyces lunaelactis]NUK97175.1 arylsulfatase [Streptomyces lunaelactis]